MGDAYRQFSSVLNNRAPLNRIDWEINPQNDPPTDDHKDQYNSKIEDGATFLAVKDRKILTKIEGEEVTLKEAANLKIETLKPWLDLKYNIPFQAYDSTRSDLSSEISERNSRSCTSETDGNYGGALSAQRVPLITSPFWSSDKKVHFEKIGFNLLNPGYSMDARTDGTYSFFKPFSTEPQIFVGKRGQPPIVEISGGGVIKSMVPVVINVDPLQTEVKGSAVAGAGALSGAESVWQAASKDWKPGSRLQELEGEPPPSSQLIDLEIGDMIFIPKRLKKKSNFFISSPVGVGGIRA
jgi:hypothetical protein